MASRGSGAQVLKDYPNLDSRELTHIIGCLSEMEQDEAKEGFTRICFKDVKIVKIEAIRNNHKPSCIWRVYYQLKDPNIELSDDSNSSNANPPSLPEDELSLKKLFDNITAECECVRMEVVRKQHTQNRSYAIVEYSPKDCRCPPCQNFEWAAEESRMRPMIAEVESNLSFLKL